MQAGQTVIKWDFHAKIVAVGMHAYYHFLCSEENSSIQGVGVEKLLEVGKLEKLKGGPLFWVDSADSQPCMGQ